MKYFYFIISFVLLACSSDDEIGSDVSTDTYYKIIEFKTLNNNPLDLNNDDVSNSYIENELTNYGNHVYDLEVKEKRNLILYSFYLPAQYISDYGFVEFALGGFVVEINNDSLNNVEIDDENYLVSFNKTSSMRYELVIKKRYFEFTNNEFDQFDFKIIYEKIQ